MSTKVLLNNVNTVTGPVYAGTPLSDAALIAAVQAQGGVLVDPSINPNVVTAAALVQTFRATGRGTPELWEGMMLAALSAVGSGISSLYEYSVASSFHDFAALGTGVKTFDYLLGPVTPYAARFNSAPYVDTWTGFDDPTHAVVNAKIGTTVGGNDIAANFPVDVTSATGIPGPFVNIPVVGAGSALAAGAQLHVRISSTVDLKTLTVGAATFRAFLAYLP
jgi:hypothetical protein